MDMPDEDEDMEPSNDAEGSLNCTSSEGLIFSNDEEDAKEKLS